MDTAEQIIDFIKNAPKKTPAKAYIQGSVSPVDTADLKVFSETGTAIAIGNYPVLKAFLDENKERIQFYHIEVGARYSAVPLADLTGYNARIEPGAIIRNHVEIGDNAVIMMGAVINIGAVIGKNTMIDMNVVVGGRAEVGENCHIGAGAVLAGVIEPPSSRPVIVEDGVVIGANAVVLEGVRIGKGAVVAAGAVVTDDVLPDTVVAGIPARFIKRKDQKTASKTQLVEALRELRMENYRKIQHLKGGWL
ncbi:MAG: 2,3,4,5-tetrahydropyridine-2,6-dicarboxylate N-acetyltransferase [Prevotellaceae bacterium]|jgi:2,3,4,5-tetrahydropyridine-2-carboxylate N-succinyltransferase/tetrahydrodipicolinate N-acetyltransferase|nr:2,3,4,5-tetrahydropyridine-2,6-dicarboxylate N-acetyltransferase [Prevotellaceae bacterium]